MSTKHPPQNDDNLRELRAIIQQATAKLNELDPGTTPNDTPQKSKLTNSQGRVKAFVVFVVSMAGAGAVYNYIVENSLSLKPIDLSSVQKIFLTIGIYFISLFITDRGIKYIVPTIYEYLINDNDSEKDFSTHFLNEITPWQKILVTCFILALLFWGFVSLASVKW
jgi:hypothetical protein